MPITKVSVYFTDQHNPYVAVSGENLEVVSAQESPLIFVFERGAKSPGCKLIVRVDAMNYLRIEHT